MEQEIKNLRHDLVGWHLLYLYALAFCCLNILYSQWARQPVTAWDVVLLMGGYYLAHVFIVPFAVRATKYIKHRREMHKRFVAWLAREEAHRNLG